MALIPTTQVNISPEDYKRKIAYALMQEGADSSPVQAWSQGAARVANAMLGQYQMNQLDQKDRQSESDQIAAYRKVIGLGGPQATPDAPPAPPEAMPPAVPPTSSPVAAALAKPVVMASNDPTAVVGPRPGGPVPPTDKVWGDQEAEAAGLYEPSKPKAAMALAGSTAPMQPTPVQSVPVAPPQSPVAAALAPKPAPNDADASTKAQIDTLLQSKSKAERQLGKALAENYLTSNLTPKFDFKTAGDSLYRTNSKTGTAEPIRDVGRTVKPMSDDERKQWKVPEGVAAGIDDNGKPVFSQPSAVNTVSPVVSGINDRFDAQMKAAQGAVPAITAIHEARRALDAGAIVGAGADQRLFLAKVGTLFGLPNEAVANTETARAALGQQVLESAKTLGANPSNADRDYIEKVKGGSIKLDEASMRKLLDIQERWGRDSVKRANENGKKLISTDPEKLGRFAPMLSVDDPPSYEDYIKANPSKTPAQPSIDPAALAEAKRRGLIP